MRSIKQLPEAVHSSVRSGIIMYDLTRVVEELVFNSLDAGATKVSVALNVGTCSVKVVDNGSGITRDGLVLLGERYATSKHDRLADVGTISGSFGFRGEALGSISDVSLLEIITRTHGMPNGYCKVIKGCNCLYLGISDDREDAGTTVRVRDLFYNQPVRRKHIQSSPKKVLHSVKNCVLRIALVHSEASFRVVDAESEDELLCTGPSPSPLPLLMSGFGIDASSSLRELNVSDGVLKLSGYVSGPCDILSSKGFQYVCIHVYDQSLLDINSRFVCKGPIHKLLNQLAVRFNSVDQWKLNSGYQNVKQSRPQICPTFLLNLTCQRSLYDITFEPSRTSVEFKDWGPVLAFTESAITQFWGDKMSDALPVKHGTGKKRCRSQKCKASLDLPPSPLKKLTEGCSNFSGWSECLNSFKKTYQDAPEFVNDQTGDDFFCQADCSIQSDDRSVGHLEGAMCQEISDYLEQSPHSIVSVKDTFFENELFATERPNKQVKCDFSSGWEDIPLKIDSEMRDVSARSALSADCVDFSDITYVNQDNINPFLRSCSSLRSLLHHDSSFKSDEGFEFRTDNFRMKGKWDGHDDGDQIFKASSPVQDRVPYVWSSLRSRTQHFKKTYPDSFPEDKMNSLSSALGDLDEENYLTSDLFNPIRESFDSNCSPVLSDPSGGVRFRDDNFINEDEALSPFEIDNDARYEYFTDRPVDGCNFGLDRVNRLGQETCSFSTLFALRSPADNRDDISGSRDLYLKSDIFSSSDTYNDETDWLWSQASGKETLTNCSVPMHDTIFNDGDGDAYGSIHIRNQGKQFDCRKRATRSQSAPPFYRGRKKFVALHNSFIMPPETSLKHLQHCSRTNSFRLPHQSSRQCHLSSIRNPVDDISDARTSPDVAVVQNSKLHGKGHGSNSCNLDSVEDSRSRRAEDLLDSGLKWRGTLPLSSGEGKSSKCKNEDSVLDISSVILHLSGDSLIPNSIDKSCLEDAKVLQQVDKKFIPIVAGRTLAIIDQHAADERIRLEELRQKVLSGELKTITYLDTEQELVLPEIGYQLLYNYAEQIQSWGWICNIHARDAKSFTKNLKVLHRQPTVTRLLAVPCILGVNLTDVDLLEYLQQLADTDGSSTIPPAVHRVLNNKACRGAIMFGDTLLPSECSLIVEELKQTSLCFQCAHGRPTTVPLVNLDVLHKQIAKLRLESRGSYESWHGFHRHKISLERAARRLT